MTTQFPGKDVPRHAIAHEEDIFDIPFVPDRHYPLLCEREFIDIHQTEAIRCFGCLRVDFHSEGYTVKLYSWYELSDPNTTSNNSVAPDIFDRIVHPDIMVLFNRIPDHRTVEPHKWRTLVRGHLIASLERKNDQKYYPAIPQGTSVSLGHWSTEDFERVVDKATPILWADSLFRFHNA